jgi:galactose mutarotase-like enzyme
VTEVLEFRSDDALVRIDPADGGRLISLLIAGVERILPKALARTREPALYWGCYPMVPWAGRLSHGRIPTSGGEVRLRPNLPPSAIHGLGFDKKWDVLKRTDTAVTMGCELGGLGWPFGGHARHKLRLSAGRLDFELQVGGYNRAGPAGLGWHPWFTRPVNGDIELRVQASDVLVVDADLAPTGEIRAVTGMEDLRSAPALGDRRLDHVYVRTRSPALVRWPDLELRIEFDRALETVVVYTPSEGFCVEPQTMWPNAPLLAAAGVTDTGIRMLEPGASLNASQSWIWRTG